MTDPAVRPAGHPTVLLGVDAGGSHTTVAVGDVQGRVRGRADGPGSAVRPDGAERSGAIIANVARRAAAEANVTLPAALAVVGAAGAGFAPARDALARTLTAVGVASRVIVRTDIEIALAAAFGDGPGVLINAGTGSIASARAPDGSLHRAGGYGWQLGDEGSGYWFGRRALAAAGRSQDGREESSTLLDRLLSALSLRNLDDLVRWSTTATPAQVAALAPHVLNAALEGERVSQRIVDEGAAELVLLLQVLARHFPGTESIPVTTTGGLLQAGSPLLVALRAKVEAELPRAKFSDAGGSVDAPVGALRLAVQLFSETA
jgi:N-acetylglucosamine kinase-like BadF-type ATPase